MGEGYTCTKRWFVEGKVKRIQRLNQNLLDLRVLHGMIPPGWNQKAPLVSEGPSVLENKQRSALPDVAFPHSLCLSPHPSSAARIRKTEVGVLMATLKSPDFLCFSKPTSHLMWFDVLLHLGKGETKIQRSQVTDPGAQLVMGGSVMSSVFLLDRWREGAEGGHSFSQHCFILSPLMCVSPYPNTHTDGANTPIPLCRHLEQWF